MRSILNFIYPRRCLLCGSGHGLLDELSICEACYGDLPHNSISCARCSLPLNLSACQQGLCAHCLKQPPVFHSGWSPFVYRQPLEWMIQQLKFNDKQMFAPLLSALMLRQIRLFDSDEDLVKERMITEADQMTLINSAVVRPDVIIPMPLHPSRLKQRGFNQSELLVLPLAKALSIPVDTRVCRRVKNTEHQTGKTAEQRRQNIKAAFTYTHRQEYQHVALFDDVVTTASSVSELSRTLLKQGVARVDVWSLARAEK